MAIPFIVGAYAAMPSSQDEQVQFYAALGEQPWVNGLEVPFKGDGATDLAWLSEQMAESFTTNVLTPIPGTMARLAQDPTFGLASPDPAGRTAALEYLIDASNQVKAFNDLMGRQFFTHILLHSAPTEHADLDAFKLSLDTISHWNVDGAKIVVEHADAFVPGQRPEKGYLTLDDELAAIEAVTAITPLITINWGRSAIEGRSADLPLAHVKQVAAAGRLAGMMFSGAHDTDNALGAAWEDTHEPLQQDDPTSIMTSAHVTASAKVARDANADYLGAKVTLKDNYSLEHRVSILRRIAMAAGAGA